MIKLKEIKKAYVKILREAFPSYKIYGMEVKEGYKKPSFFVRIIANGGNERNTFCTYTSSYTIETIYFQQNIKEENALETIQIIRERIGSYLKVKDRMLPISDFSYRMIGKEGNIPQLEFDLNFLDFIEEEEMKEKMNKVEIKEEIKNGVTKH